MNDCRPGFSRINCTFCNFGWCYWYSRIFSGVGAEPVTAHEIIVGCIQLFSIQTDNKSYLKTLPQKKASAKAGRIAIPPLL
jgi:hypothetical protein